MTGFCELPEGGADSPGGTLAVSSEEDFASPPTLSVLGPSFLSFSESGLRFASSFAFCAFVPHLGVPSLSTPISTSGSSQLKAEAENRRTKASKGLDRLCRLKGINLIPCSPVECTGRANFCHL